MGFRKGWLAAMWAGVGGAILVIALLSALLLGWCRTQGARIFQRL